MLTFPIPFVTSLILFVITIVLLKMRNALLIKTPIVVFSFTCAVLSALVAWRWTADTQLPRVLMPIFASSLGALAWFCFRPQHYVHALPVLGVAIITLIYPLLHLDPDWFVGMCLCAYGVALIRIGIHNHEFSWVKLTQVRQASNLAIFAGIWLCWTALVDVWVAWGFIAHHGIHAPTIVSGAHVMLLICIGYFALSIATLQMPRRAQPTTDKNTQQLRTDEYPDIMDRLTQWLIADAGYQDSNLNLDMMARKIGVPARIISQAINDTTGTSVSQWMNALRIQQAQIKLTETTESITDIMYDCGYITKSNFNKEFKRLTGLSPTAWRQKHQR